MINPPSLQNNVIIQQNSRKLLVMDILMSETCWAHKKWNKIASDIKLVFYSSASSTVHYSYIIVMLIGDSVLTLQLKLIHSTTSRSTCTYDIHLFYPRSVHKFSSANTLQVSGSRTRQSFSERLLLEPDCNSSWWSGMILLRAGTGIGLLWMR